MDQPRRAQRGRARAAGVALALLLATGCGSGGDGDNEAAAPPSALAAAPAQPAPVPAPAAPQPLPLPGAPLAPPRLDTAIEGRVAFGDRQPLVGARVLMVAASVLAPRAKVLTDASGRYRIEGLREGTLTLAVISREGRQLGRQSVEVAEGKTSELDFLVEGEPAGMVEGRVTDGVGNGLASLRVFIESDASIFKDDPTRTSGDGSFSLGSVAPGAHEVVVVDSAGDVVASESIFVEGGAVTSAWIVVSGTRAGTAASGVDPETCEGVLDEPPPTLTLRLISAEEASRDDPSVASACVAAVQSTDDEAKGLSVTLTRLESPAAAQARFSTLLFTTGAEAAEEGPDLRSFMAVDDLALRGSVYVIQNREYVIRVHTTVKEGESPAGLPDSILTYIEELARSVSSQLP